MSGIARDSGDGNADRLLAAAARGALAARERLSTAAVDLFLTDDARLSDQQRLTMARLLHALLTAIEDDLRLRLVDALRDHAPPELIAALGTAGLDIAGPILERAKLLRDADLVAVVMRRADEDRLVRAVRFGAGAPSVGGLVDGLIAGGDDEVAAAAMALLVAEDRRFDGFGDPLVARTDLPAELQHRLVWWIGAALRDYALSRHEIDADLVDRAIVGAATAMLVGYDEGETLEGRALTLAGVLGRRGALDDMLVEAAVAQGHLILAAAALALRAGLEPAIVWEMMVDGDGARLAVLLRSIGCPRDGATRILLPLVQAAGGDEAALIADIESYEALDPAHAVAALAPWRLDGEYRRAIAGIAGRGGEG